MVSAIAVVQYKPHPGKEPDFIGLMKEAQRLTAQHGLSQRLFLSVLAGPNVGMYALVLEATDLATLAAGLQNFLADPARQSLGNRLRDVSTLVSLGQATEVPL